MAFLFTQMSEDDQEGQNIQATSIYILNTLIIWVGKSTVLIYQSAKRLCVISKFDKIRRHDQCRKGSKHSQLASIVNCALMDHITTGKSYFFLSHRFTITMFSVDIIVVGVLFAVVVSGCLMAMLIFLCRLEYRWAFSVLCVFRRCINDG